jgi:hypothetical protein
MLIGYMRVSRADGSQVLDLQRDALLAAGVSPDHLYEDLASGKRDDRPGLVACLKALRPGDTLLVWRGFHEVMPNLQAVISGNTGGTQALDHRQQVMGMVGRRFAAGFGGCDVAGISEIGRQVAASLPRYKTLGSPFVAAHVTPCRRRQDHVSAGLLHPFRPGGRPAKRRLIPRPLSSDL